MPSNEISFFLNGKFVYKFQNVQLQDGQPYYLAVTLHNTFDKVSFVENSIKLDDKELLMIYQKCEEKLQEYQEFLQFDILMKAICFKVNNKKNYKEVNKELAKLLNKLS